MDVKIDMRLLLDITEYFFKLESEKELTEQERRITDALDSKLKRIERRIEYQKSKL